MIYLACLSAGGLIVFILLWWQAKMKAHAEQLSRELEIEKAKTLKGDLGKLSLVELVDRSNKRARFKIIKGRRGSDPDEG